MLSVTRVRAMCVAFTCALAVPLLAQPLPQDPKLVTGELDNGLKYVIKQHTVPPGRATVWMHIHTGSINETDQQRGLAHYLEHMAFNGSKNFPPGAVVPLFQSLGMTFGRDQNAFTSFEQTTYQLSLPDAKTETLDKGMLFFSDVLFRLSLPPKEIDDERQIIQEERRRGLSGRQRVGFYVLERIAPGSLYGSRIPIGTEETINSVKEQDFRDYYGKWYVASNATLMVVADADPAVIVDAIKKHFGEAPKRERPTPQDPRVSKYNKSFAIVAHDPEVRSEEIQITRIEPARPPTTTVEQLRGDLVSALGEMAMNRRLEAKVAAGGTSYQNARVSTSNDVGMIYTADLTARAAEGKWKEALEEVSLELQRARKYGFSEREIEDARKQLISGAERAVETADTIPAQAVLGRMNNDVTSREPIMAPSDELAHLRKILPTISLEEVAKRFATEFDPSTVSFTATLPTSPSVPTEEQLLALGTKALAVEPSPEKEKQHATALMTELPKPGTISDTSEHADTRVTSVWLNNGVRVHYRFMDDRKNDVSVRISLIGGELLETAENHGITAAAQLAFGRPATDKLSSTDIRELLTGKKVNVGGGGGGGRGRRGGGGGGGMDSMSFSVSGSPEDLETGMQLAHLLLTVPKIEASAFEQFQQRTREMLQEALKNPMMAGMRVAQAMPYPENEPRTKPLTVEEVDKLTLPAAQAWLNKLVKESPIEVTIVGDLPKERALKMAEQYLGSLPARAKVDPKAFASLRKLERPAGPRVVSQTVDTPTPQAFVLSGFYGCDESNVADATALGMAARILTTRMVKEVREEAQLVYSISAGSRPASAFPGFGVFAAGAPTEPHKADALVDKLKSMYAVFAEKGPTDEEMEVAKKQVANTLDEELRDPGYWMGRLDRLTWRDAKLDDITNEGARAASMTATQVRDTFAKYYSEKSSMVVVVKPTNSPSEQPKKEGGSGSR